MDYDDDDYGSDDSSFDGDDDTTQQGVGMGEYGSFNYDDVSDPAAQFLKSMEDLDTSDSDLPEYGQMPAEGESGVEKSGNMVDDELGTLSALLEGAVARTKRGGSPAQLAANIAEVKKLKSQVRAAEKRDVGNDNSHMLSNMDAGMASKVSVHTEQFSHQSPQVRHTLGLAVSGDLDNSRSRRDQVDVDAAVALAGSVLGSDPAQLVGGNIRPEQLAGDVITFDKASRSSYEPAHGSSTSYTGDFSKESQLLPKDTQQIDTGGMHSSPYVPDSKTVALALGQLTGMEAYQDRGVVGGTLAPAVEQDEEARIYGIINKHAAMYIPENTKNGTASVQQARHESVVAALTHRYMNVGGVDSKSLVPLPNELTLPNPDDRGGDVITGLIPTSSYWRGTTTAYDTVGFEQAIQPGGNLENVTGDALWEYRPSRAQTLFPITRDIDGKTGEYRNPTDEQKMMQENFPDQSAMDRAKADRQFKMDIHTLEAKEAATYLRKMHPHMSNESDGDSRWGSGSTIATAGQDAMNQAFVYGLNRDTIDAHGPNNMKFPDVYTDPDGNVVKESNDIFDVAKSGDKVVYNLKEGYTVHRGQQGTSAGGMYGDKRGESSETSEFVKLVGEGVDEETAAEIAGSFTTGLSLDMDKDPALDVAANGYMGPYRSDHERYQQELLSAPEQRSDEWHALRRGNLTASRAANLLKNPSLMGQYMAEDRLDPTGALGYHSKENDFKGNAYTRQGTDGERKVQAAFMSYMKQQEGFEGMQYEEGIFETRDDMPGIGASPDGRLFDADGKSMGLVEFKFLGSKGAKKAVKTYTDQMQMQMLVGGEEYNTLAVLDTQTGEYFQHTIQADPEHQQRLLDAAEIAQSVANEVQDVTGLQTVRKLISTGTGSKRSPETVEAKGKAGEEARYEEPVDAVDEAVVAFDSEGGEAAPVDDTVLGRATAATQQALWDKANASDKVKSVDRAHTGAIEEQRQRDLKKHHAPMVAKEEQAGRMNAEFDKQQAAADKESLSVQKEMDSLHKQALQEERARTIAVRDSASAFEEFKANLDGSSKMLNVLSDAMDDFIKLEGKGISAGMDLKRLGMNAGLSGEETFGMQVELMRGGQSEKMANASIMEAGAMANQLQDPTAQAAMLVRMETKLGKSGNSHLMSAMPMEFLSTKPAANVLAEKMVEVTSGLDPRDRVLLMEAAGLDSLLTYDPTATESRPENLTSTRELDEKNIMAANVGKVDMYLRERQGAINTVKNNEEAAYAQGGKVAANEISEGYKTPNGFFGKIAKLAANVAATAFDSTLGTNFQETVSTATSDAAMAAFRPEPEPTIPDKITGGIINALPPVALFQGITAIPAAVDGVSNYVGGLADGIGERFEAGTGWGTNPLPDPAIGGIPTTKSSQATTLNSKVNVTVNNNADGTEVITDDNGEESSFLNFFSK